MTANRRKRQANAVPAWRQAKNNAASGEISVSGVKYQAWRGGGMSVEHDWRNDISSISVAKGIGERRRHQMAASATKASAAASQQAAMTIVDDVYSSARARGAVVTRA